MSRRTVALIGGSASLLAVAIALLLARGRPIGGAAPADYASEGTGLAKSGQVTEAVVRFNRGIALTPATPEPYIGLAVLYESLNRPDLAIETLEQLQAANPKAKHLGCRLAEAHLGVEDLKQARAIGAKAVQDEPDCVRAHSVYGLTMLRFRYWDTAAAELQRAMRLAPEDTEIGQVLVDVYIQQAAYDKAIALGESLLPKTAKPARLQYKLGWAYGRRPQQGDTAARAIAHLKAATAAAPDWFEPYAELGRAYLSQGDRAGAQGAFERAWKLNPTVPGVAYNLAAIYQGRDEGRRAAMERRFHELLKEKERFTAMRRDYNSGEENVQNTQALAATEGSAEMYGAALYRLRKVLRADPSNIAALRLYVNLDQRARAGYPDYLAPGPGVSPAQPELAGR